MPDLTHAELTRQLHASDPEPPACRIHQRSHRQPRGMCDTCTAHARWQQRAYRVFRAHGMRFNEPPADPRPADCPHGHTYLNDTKKICAPCNQLWLWRARSYHRARRAGQPLQFTDVAALRAHITALEDAGLDLYDIAAASNVSHRQLRDVRAGRRQLVLNKNAQRLLEVPVPARDVRLLRDEQGRSTGCVDATGTARKIRCAQRAGYGQRWQAKRLGWTHSALTSWIARGRVPLYAAEAVDQLYWQIIVRPGPCRNTATLAAAAGYPLARFFSRDNIDDPNYDPFKIVKNPLGVYRRLRSLAWMGQGPQQVAEYIGEAAEQVAIWLEGGPAPAYAHHLVDAAFEALSGTFGPDNAIAARARQLRWAPPLAWHGIDIDLGRARPCHDLPPGHKPHHYPLESQVWHALFGLLTADELIYEEKVRVVRVLHNLGWSDPRIAVWLRWHPDGDVKKGTGAVCRFRKDAKIGHPDVPDDTAAEASDELLVAA